MAARRLSVVAYLTSSGKKRVAIFLGLHGPFSGEQKAGWADARRVENG
jgi:hypothetical protein